MILVVLGLTHIFLLHEPGSSQPGGAPALHHDATTMFPLYIYKDSLGLLALVMVGVTLIFLYPDLLGHWDNYTKADPTVTPPHIVPEWYFLWVYAILRSIPHKLLGVIALVFAVLILFTFPIVLEFKLSSMDDNPVTHGIFFIWVFTVLLLGGIGAHSPTDAAVMLGRISSVLYFSYPLLAWSLLTSAVEENDLVATSVTAYGFQSE
jgi:ubiquinol-cytochrome c reductase cytochrome b subunit